MGALDSIRVLDFTRAMAGPYCTMMLGDMGAEIWKIEMPGKGDETRSWGPPFFQNDVSAYFVSANRNKKSITLNLKHPRSKEVVERLATKCDILVENFRPGTMAKLGSGYDRISAVNPDIIYCSISGFGQDGPYTERAAYDIIMQGMGGLMSITGEEGRPPVKVGIAITDIAAGMFANSAILAALYSREKGSGGQYIDISMLDCQAAWMSHQASAYFATGKNPERMGSKHPQMIPNQAVKSRNGYVIVGAGNDRLWAKMCTAAGRTDLIDDPRFSTNPDRIRNREILDPLLDEIFQERDTEEWVEIMLEAGVPCGPVLALSQLFKDPQVIQRDMVIEAEHPTAGTIKLTGFPMKFSSTPERLSIPPPLLGQHKDEILAAAGYSADEIEKLKREKVV
ncbi:MAG TPA: CoA transferase [Euryarchaeota archaeon]|nr:CoA transferase [Euryarchaeota archaeon]